MRVFINYFKFLGITFLLTLLSLLSYGQPLGNALAFSGANNYVSIPDHIAFNVTNAVTFEAWIKPCKVSGQNMIVSKFWCVNDQNAYDFSILDGKLRWRFNVGSCNTGGSVYQTTSPIIQLNVWQHVAVVHTSTGVTFYLNGVAVTAAGFVNGGASVLKLSSEPLRIGAYRNISGAYGLFYTGFMDEVRMWDHAVSATNISARYNNTLTGNETGLIAYYIMNGFGSGNGMTISNYALNTGASLNGITTGNVLTPYYGTGNFNSILGNDTTLCQGEILTLDATAPTAAYVWQDTSTNATFNVSQQGVYWVEVMIMSNCSNSDTINVTFTPAPVVSLGNDTVLCDGDSLFLDVSNSNSIYLWQNNSTDSIFTITQTGTYWVQVTKNNCLKTDTINVTYLPSPVVDLGADTVLCFGGSVLLDATVPGASYLWQNSSPSPFITVNQTGVYFVKVTLNNCSTNDSIEVSVIDLSSFNIGPDTAVCDGDVFSVDASTANAGYLWGTGAVSSSITVNQAGLYWVEINTICGATSDSINVGYNPYPIVNLGNDSTLCAGDSVMLNASSPLSSYSWQNGSTASSFEVTHQGVFWVTVTSLNCPASDTVIMNYTQPSVLNLGNDTALCEGEVLSLDVTTNYASYLWQNGTSFSNLNIFQTGIYWVELTSPCGLQNDSIFVQFNPLPVVDLGIDTSLCQNEVWNMDVSIPNASYRWQDNSTNGIYSIGNSGHYWVEITLNECTSSDSVNVEINPALWVDFGNDTTLCFDQELMLEAKNFEAAYVWQNNTTEPSFNIHTAGTYWVLVSNHCGVVSDTLSVEYEVCECNFFIPNAFSPNNDRLNDTFLPESNCVFYGYLITIYNRWGQVIFESEDPEIMWDGTCYGKDLQLGVYAYVIRYNLLQKNVKTDYHTIYGNVNLIK